MLRPSTLICLLTGAAESRQEVAQEVLFIVSGLILWPKPKQPNKQEFWAAAKGMELLWGPSPTGGKENSFRKNTVSYLKDSCNPTPDEQLVPVLLVEV